MSRSWDIANCIATDSVWECLTIAIRTPLVAQLGVAGEPSWGRWRGNLTVVAIASTMIGPWSSYAAILTAVTIIKSVLAVITGPVAVAIPYPVRAIAFHNQWQ